MKSLRLVVIVLSISMLVGIGAYALRAQQNPKTFQTLRWRSVGPDRGGRSAAVTGVVSDRFVYYMGATGGGVWKTEDAGITWMPVSDHYFTTGAVGSIAVADSSPNVVYVGMGEDDLRSNLSHGDGVYKSTDAGKTWRNVGLRETSQIGKVLVDPKNPDLVYVAAIGHPYGPNEERGVFRSQDGGATWKKVLYVNENTGADDLAMDPRDPKTVYASTWQIRRMPWDINEFGPGSGIYKTTDGGETWTQLKDGLPKTDMGKIGVTVSPVDSNRLWATVGGVDGGIFKSDDAGKTWQLMDGSFEKHARQYYYGKINADPKQRDTVYTMVAKNFWKSTDAGITWDRIQTPHGDYHGLWIDPNDNQRMVVANDGGGTVTFNGGKSWSSEDNQPTAQFYTVKTDNSYPYRIMGAQQDNTTVSMSSDAVAGGGRGGPAFVEVGGGESGYVVPDVKDPNLVYAGGNWGILTIFDRRTGEAHNISVWPDLPVGRTAADVKYRFQWTFPIAVSPAEPGAVFTGGNVVFKSVDQGQSWKPISPDLTRNDKVRENGGRLEDIYCTVFTIAPSPLDKNIIWAGSDDGLIHVTRDGGKSWSDVTPPAIKPWTRINVMEASPVDPATAYAAVNRYQMDDFHPYLYRTHDYGKTWTLVVNGIASDTFVRSVRQDLVNPKLLFAATESAVYFSPDDGDHWQSLQLNMPVVPITDLAVKEGDLIAATQGRSFWILDDITPLEQPIPADSAAHLLSPRPAYRSEGRGEGRGGRGGAGTAFGPGNAIVDYYLPQAATGPLTLEFEDASGKPIRTFSNVEQAGTGRKPVSFTAQDRPQALVPAEPGLNRFSWDMHYPEAHGIDGGTFLFGGNIRGPAVMPGKYKVKLTVGGQSVTQDFEIKADPRMPATSTDYQTQMALLLAARDKLSAANDAINQIRAIERQLDSTLQAARGNATVTNTATKLKRQLDAVLHDLYEPTFTGYDDQTLVRPMKLNNRVAAIQNALAGDHPVSAQAREVYNDLASELDEELGGWKQVLAVDLPAFNAQLKAAGLPAITVPDMSGTQGPN